MHEIGSTHSPAAGPLNAGLVISSARTISPLVTLGHSLREPVLAGIADPGQETAFHLTKVDLNTTRYLLGYLQEKRIWIARTTFIYSSVYPIPPIQLETQVMGFGAQVLKIVGAGDLLDLLGLVGLVHLQTQLV